MKYTVGLLLLAAAGMLPPAHAADADPTRVQAFLANLQAVRGAHMTAPQIPLAGMG